MKVTIRLRGLIQKSLRLKLRIKKNFQYGFEIGKEFRILYQSQRIILEVVNSNSN